MSKADSPRVNDVAWSEEFGFSRNLQSLMENNFLVLPSDGGPPGRRSPSPSSHGNGKVVVPPGAFKARKSPKHAAKHVPSIASISAKKQLASDAGMEACNSPKNHATKMRPSAAAVSPVTPDDSGPLSNQTSVNKMLRTLESQVEDWLAIMIEQAGHSVVVPGELEEAYKAIVSKSQAAASLAQSTRVKPMAHILDAPLNRNAASPGSVLLKEAFLDRDTLSTLGLPMHLIDRVYRALYVYTMGFHDLVSEIHKHSQQSDGISKIVWQIFVHLLEEVDSEDYKTMMGEMASVHKGHIDTMQKR